MAGFWDKLQKPIMALAPMEEVTDTVFRQIVMSVGKPDVMFTEFANVDAIIYATRNAQNSVLELPTSAKAESGSLRADFAGIPAPLQRLLFNEIERPIVAQIWGTEPEKFCEAARILKDLKFDAIDINFGCPVKKVLKGKACGAMIGDNNRAAEIIAATREGVGGLPVSVKTRIGYKKIVTEEWIGFLLEQGLAAITIHGRTVAEESKVPAHWEEIGKAVEIRDQMFSGSDLQSLVLDSRKQGLAARARFASPAPLLIGNGDIKSLAEAKEKVREFGVDGVMMGRGIFANPALFAGQELTAQEKLRLYLRHVNLFRETWGTTRNWQVLKKFMKVYTGGAEGAGGLRSKLAAAATADELAAVINTAITATMD